MTESIISAKSRSALTRVLKRLNAVIAGLIRVACKDSCQAMDYHSLMSLSNSSRLQAIKAFDQLSHRLHSKSSHSSIVSTATSKSSKSSKSSRTSKSSRSRASASTASSKDTAQKKTTRISKTEPHFQPPETQRLPSPPRYNIRRKALPQEASRTPPPSSDVRRKALPPLPPTTIQTPLLDSMEYSRRLEEDLGLGLRRRPSMMDRFSLLTMESGSTKLGEIPERKWHRGYDEWDCRGNEYSAPVVYPLRPCQPVVKERRFLGLFRRGI